MSPAGPLAGQVALVTGASRGIGRAIAVALARQGAYVAVNYGRNLAAAEETLASLRAAGGDGELLGFDVSDSAAVNDATKTPTTTPMAGKWAALARNMAGL
jgi:3-oxoacyl-[acyl-carrier protein] reductase